MQILDLRDEPQHLPTLAAWHQRQWSYLNPAGTLEDRIERMKRYLNADFVPSTFIAKDGDLLGSAAIVVSDMDTRPELTPWLASVFVSPEYRRRGVGTRLVEYVMQRARAAGIGTLYLFTPDRKAFYRKLGWRVLSEEEYRGHGVTVMSVELND